MSFRKMNSEIELKNDTKISLNSQKDILEVSGKHGKMNHKIPESISVIIKDNVISFDKKREILYEDRKFIGTFISLLNSSIIGVNDLHETRVIFNGTGVSVEIQDSVIEMKLGKSHKIYRNIPEGLICEASSIDVKTFILSVKGVNKGLVTKFASEFRVKRSYKGGIHVYIEGKKPKLKEKKGA